MFNISDRVRINEDLCPEAKRTEKKFQFGSLNYFALMLTWEFEVVRTFKDDYHGDMMEVKITEAGETPIDNIKSNVVLKSADVVLAMKTMLKMDYEILEKTNSKQVDIDALNKTLSKLIAFRKTKKSEGIPIADKSLVKNWDEIKSIRGQIKKLESESVQAFKVKHKLGTFLIEGKEEDISRKLRALIRQQRAETKKIVPKVKDIGGGLTLEKIGGVFTKSGKFAELNEKLAANIIKEHKKPTTADNYVGIEIEMLSPKSIEEMNKEFIKARLHRYVNVGTDGSIRSDVDNVKAMELRICLPENSVDSILKQVCEVLRKNDCYANRSCGMHVHIDMRNRDAELCYRNFFKVQDIMLQSQPQARRKNTYCQPNTLDKIKMADFGKQDRYKVINTQSYIKNDMKTLEIRVHEGATKFRDVSNWVKFLVTTASLKTELSKPVKSVSELTYLDSKIADHLAERIEEYSA